VRWFYNNWDFDAAGIAFEKIAHKDIFDALRDDLAVPLRFQDFDRSRQRKKLRRELRPFRVRHLPAKARHGSPRVARHFSRHLGEDIVG
jgi:CubicO group peptidase (beta-lactamase class C family)